ncbi:hypothetical protein KUTeg_014743 [Tegillarca granosa]|uniref:Ig-like domain-containing protein n=1 Tax=Tegillarca granosa TaxID=220873 RepID=A0ABQ9EWR0_TEGGR|nr:hypothetical protein KUTeg_014743 [Tegillarca granosa]
MSETKAILDIYTGIEKTIQGSNQFVAPDQPYILTCTFASNVISSKHIKKNYTIIATLQIGLNNTCYNVLNTGPVVCDSSVCFCSQGKDIFTARWSFASINEPVISCVCQEGTSSSPTLILKKAGDIYEELCVRFMNLTVSLVRLNGVFGSQKDTYDGQIISLTCVRRLSRPCSYIQWYIGNDNYTINSTSTVTNGQDELTSVTNRLNPNAQIKDVGDSLSVTDSTPVTLQCEVEGGIPLSVISWDCFCGVATNESKSGIARSIITFTASRSFNGKFCICKANHPASVIKYDSVQIIVTWLMRIN